MRIAVIVTRSLHGSGFATRTPSMLEAYAAGGHEVDVFHYRLPHEDGLRSSIVPSLHRYVAIAMAEKSTFRQHVALLPPLAWQCTRAHSRSAREACRYDVVQAETSNTWAIARTVPAAKRLAVLHDDDSARLRGLAKILPGGVRRAATGVSARKYTRWQHIVLREADRSWFASEIERDRLAATVPQARTRVIPNGADDELWLVPDSEGSSRKEVLFVAPGFYEPNASGLAWFLKEVWPLVKQRVSDGHVRIVGVGWEGFDPHPDVTFAGWRDSLVDEYSRARVVIAPLFAGGGTKLKVVEAMASARPVVTTPVGAEGVPLSEGVCVSSDPYGFASAVTAFLTDAILATQAGHANREAVETLRWSSIWKRASLDLADLVGQEL